KQQLLDELVRSPEFDRFLRVIQLVRTQYVDPLPLDQLLEGAARGVVAATGDPFSAYFDPEEFREFRMDVSGHYTGIGVTVSQAGAGGVGAPSASEGPPGATRPFEGAKPGDPGGLRPGDVIVAVDGKDATGESVEAVARMIRGPEGTQVTVEVMRRGHDRP